MTDATDKDARHEGSSFEPVPREAGTSGGYPPEADPDKVDGLTDAEVPGEQVDPDRRLTGGDQADASTGSQDEQVMPGSEEPPD